MLAERVTGPVAFHGEGPCWWDGVLRWVDMLAGDVLSLEADGTVARQHVGDVVAALRPRRGGGAVLALERQFALLDAAGELELLPELWGDGDVRFNEGGCDPDGRFYCGSVAYDARPGAAALYRLSPDRRVELVLGGLTISNGLAWSRDGTRAFYVDTPTGRVDVFDYDTAAGIHGRRPFVEIPAAAGQPDGLTVDAEDGVWVALYGGGAVHRYDTRGRLDAVVTVPTPKPTACAFGGDGLTTLYVTTTQERTDHPGAGCLYAADVGVRGLPALPFAG